MGFGGVDSFTQLSDTPRSYAGQALKALGVKAGENGLEFVLGLPPLAFGPGFNFLKVSQVGGQPFVEWADIQGLIIALTGAVNRIVTPPELVALFPVASEIALAAASPPGRTALPSIQATAPEAIAVAAANAAAPSTSAPDLPVPAPTITASAVLV